MREGSEGGERDIHVEYGERGMDIKGKGMDMLYVTTLLIRPPLSLPPSSELPFPYLFLPFPSSPPSMFIVIRFPFLFLLYITVLA